MTGLNPVEAGAARTIPPGLENCICDAWGNIRGEPLCTVEERHGDDFCRILVYAVNGLFYYGFQLKIGTTIRQTAANIGGRAFRSADLARSAASLEIEKVCTGNRNTLKLFAEFIRIRYNQGSLFEGLNDG